jgi:hypothetical protein
VSFNSSLLLALHGLFNEQADDGATREAGNATAIQPVQLRLRQSCGCWVRKPHRRRVVLAYCSRCGYGGQALQHRQWIYQTFHSVKGLPSTRFDVLLAEVIICITKDLLILIAKKMPLQGT